MEKESIGFYGILDYTLMDSSQFIKTAELYLKAGVKYLEIKAIHAPKKIIFELVEDILKLKNIYQFNLFLYGNADIVKLLNLDGIHIDKNHLSFSEIKGYIPTKKIAISSYSFEDAYEAYQIGADFVTMGPLFASESLHIGSYNRVSLDVLKESVKLIPIPIIAFGGINLGNITKVLETGVSAITLASDILKDASPFEKIKSILSIFEGDYCAKNIAILNKSDNITQNTVNFIENNFRNMFCFKNYSLEEIDNRSEKNELKLFITCIDEKEIDSLPKFESIIQKLNLKWNQTIILTDTTSIYFKEKTDEKRYLAVLDIRDPLQFKILDLILQSVSKK
ncbi:thiamine phosphate synthase [bacterium]|nr:thiamine phosphate synthase [bacterium]